MATRGLVTEQPHENLTEVLSLLSKEMISLEYPVSSDSHALAVLEMALTKAMPIFSSLVTRSNSEVPTKAVFQGRQSLPQIPESLRE